MKKLLLFACAALCATLTHAAEWYVADGGDDSTNDGSSWDTPFESIQHAIDTAADNDTIIVGNGTYREIETNNKPITIKSRNGAKFTIIDGGGSTRCATLATDPAHTASTLIGFTLQNGNARDGGGSYGGTLMNCTITGNSAFYDGGGSYGGTLTNCSISENSADRYGGGAFDSTLTNCSITKNIADNGGGAYDGTLTNCTISGNSASGDGGGAFDSTLTNCTITGNSANHGGGAYDGTLTNCSITKNTANHGGGAVGGTLTNCTITGNSANEGGGGGSYYGTLENCTITGNTNTNGNGGSYYGTLTNCIVWGNTNAAGQTDIGKASAVSYCFAPGLTSGTGNIDSDTAGSPFVNFGAGDYRLQPASPCAGAGNPDSKESLDRNGSSLFTNGRINMGALTTLPSPTPGAKYYVSASYGNDSNDGESWETPFKTIQYAIGKAADNETIMVDGGIYGFIETDNKPITIQSLNGADFTVIDGGGSTRCATLGFDEYHTASTLIGFTLQNGSATNGGGSFGGTLKNCTITGNSANYGGGSLGSTLTNCTITGNSAEDSGGTVGGTLTNCTISGNSANYGGGSSYGTLTNCTITGNTATNGSGGFVGSLADSLKNCIVWGNTNAEGKTDIGGSPTISYCFAPGLIAENGNIDSDTVGSPLFADPEAGDYRLQLSSPCAGKGSVAPEDLEELEKLKDRNGQSLVTNGRVNMGSMAIITQWHVSPSGDDTTNDGLSWASPFKTIQHAIDTAADNDTIIVGDGTYTPITTDNKPITIKSLNGAESTVIDGGGTTRCATLGTDLAHTASTLIGFTLQNGKADNNNGYYGGGSYGGTLTNCTISGNSAFYGGGANGGTLKNCTITENSADYGGGAYGGMLTNCTITGNTATQDGGGANSGTLTNCTITKNTADYGGGASGGTLTNCTITKNTANYGGGADGGTLTNCTITGNTATQDGGGAYGSTLTNCTITGNTATNGSGGGAYDGTLTNCTITGNTATNGSGGGAYDGTLTNCTITGNTANNGNGGFWGNAFTSLTNCIVWGNTNAERQTDIGGDAVISYSFAPGLASENGNIDSDTAGSPMFANPEAGDYHLLPNSPCAGAGDPASEESSDRNGHSLFTRGRINMGSMAAITYISSNRPYGVDPIGSVTPGESVTANAFSALDGRDFIGFFTNGVFAAESTRFTWLPKSGDLLVAVYQTQVSLSLAGGAFADADEPAQLFCAYGSAYPALPEPVREGHTFKGWRDALETTITSATIMTNQYDHALTAYWEEVPTVTITATSNLSGGIEPFGDRVTPKETGLAFTAPLTDRAFIGFFTNGVCVASDSSFTFKPEADAELTALYETIVYLDGMGGNVASHRIFVKSGEAYPTLPEPTREWYTFTGWCFDEAGTRPVGAGAVVTNALDHALYARWFRAEDAPPAITHDDAAPFPLGGTYSGFLHQEETDETHRIVGTFTSTVVAQTGRITASVLIGGKRLSFKATTLSGTTEEGIPFATMTEKNGSQLTLFLSGNTAWGQLLTPESEAYAVDGGRNRFTDKTDLEAQALLPRLIGAYTALHTIETFAEASYVPEGSGYLTVTVSKKGVARMAGVLPDGTTYTHSTPLLLYRQFEGFASALPFFSTLRSKAGAVSGLLWITDDENEGRRIQTDSEGGWPVLWDRSATTGANAFTTAVEGAFWNPAPVLPPELMLTATPGSIAWYPANATAPSGLLNWNTVENGLPLTLNAKATGYTVPKAVGPFKDDAGIYDFSGVNSAKTTFSLAMKTGIFKGKFNGYIQVPGVRIAALHTAPARYAGVFIQNPDGTLLKGHGHALVTDTEPTAKKAKIKRSFPISLQTSED